LNEDHRCSWIKRKLYVFPTNYGVLSPQCGYVRETVRKFEVRFLIDRHNDSDDDQDVLQDRVAQSLIKLTQG